VTYGDLGNGVSLAGKKWKEVAMIASLKIDPLKGLSAERFQSRIGIVGWNGRGLAYHPSREHRWKFLRPGVLTRHPPSVHPRESAHDPSDQPWNVTRVVLKVGVYDHDYTGPRVFKPRPESGGLPKVNAVSNDLELAPGRPDSGRYLRGTIIASIVNYNDLGPEAGMGHRLVEARDAGAKAFLFVISGSKDRYVEIPPVVERRGYAQSADLIHPATQPKGRPRSLFVARAFRGGDASFLINFGDCRGTLGVVCQDM
jgi:hypothetical protein